MRTKPDLKEKCARSNLLSERNDPMEDFPSHMPRFAGDLMSPLTGTAADPYGQFDWDLADNNPTALGLVLFVALQICVGLTIFFIL